MNLIRSGVLVPLLLAFPDAGGDSVSLGLTDASVVILVACVVSADGGGGSSIARSGSEESICARQRKHSPLP